MGGGHCAAFHSHLGTPPALVARNGQCAGGAQRRGTDPGVLTGTVLKGMREGKTHEDTLSIFRN